MERGSDQADGNPLVTHEIHAVDRKRKEPRRRFIALDTEDDSKGEVLIVNFYDGETHYSFWKGMALRRGRSHFLEMAVRELLRVADEKNTIIVAHNLEYDLNNLFQWCNWAFISEMRYSSRLITAKMEGIAAECWDSFNLCPTSLKKMAALVGMKKGDFKESRDAGILENLEYCKGDCEILWKFMDSFQELSLDSIGVGIRPTVGGLAMRAWRKNHMTPNVIAAHSTDAALKAYYGGRTEAFFIGKTKRTIVSDVRSMYPTQMRKCYPDCETLEEGTSWRTHEYGYGFFELLVPKGTAIPCLPMRHGGRLFFPAGKVKGWYTYAEVRYAVEERGYMVLGEFFGVGTNEGKPYFLDYVDKFYALRREAVDSGDEVGKQFYKLLLNNLYGKFAMNRPRTIVAKEEPRKQPGKSLEAIRTLGPFGVWQETSDRPADTTNFLWAAYVTGYSRIHLHRLLQGVHDQGHKLLYCDTDSVMFEPVSDKRPYIVGTELGMMEEEEYLDGEFITAKGYYLRYQEDGQDKFKIACKGVPNHMAMEFFATGSAKVERPVKMREGFVQGLKANVWREVEKTMRTVYMKRKVGRDGCTRPWTAEELPKVAAILDKGACHENGSEDE